LSEVLSNTGSLSEEQIASAKEENVFSHSAFCWHGLYASHHLTSQSSSHRRN